jgi:hypothetical protein
VTDLDILIKQAAQRIEWAPDWYSRKVARQAWIDLLTEREQKRRAEAENVEQESPVIQDRLDLGL